MDGKISSTETAKSLSSMYHLSQNVPKDSSDCSVELPKNEKKLSGVELRWNVFSS